MLCGRPVPDLLFPSIPRTRTPLRLPRNISKQILNESEVSLTRRLKTSPWTSSCSMLGPPRTARCGSVSGACRKEGGSNGLRKAQRDMVSKGEHAATASMKIAPAAVLVMLAAKGKVTMWKRSQCSRTRDKAGEIQRERMCVS